MAKKGAVKEVTLKEHGLRLMGVAQKWVKAEIEIAERANDFYSDPRLRSLAAAVEFALWTRENLGVID